MPDTKQSRPENLRTLKFPCMSLSTHFVITEINRELNTYYPVLS